jgi:hypothetical protein
MQQALHYAAFYKKAPTHCLVNKHFTPKQLFYGVIGQKGERSAGHAV